VEILSPEDSFSRAVRKCGLYARWGIRRVVLIDPADRTVWSFENVTLQQTDFVARRGTEVLSARQLWQDLDRRLSRSALPHNLVV
jgi:Uma2 family endonuclease